MSKMALVLEGGAMRGMYTAGVLDSFMDEGLKFDAIVGASAGALFGVNFLSKQRGRAVRYCKTYNHDKDYMGILPYLKTGNLIDTDYAYKRVPFELDPFDDETYKQSKVPFYAVVTNVITGRPEYKQVKSVLDQMDLLRASGSMPFAAKPVEIGKKLYLDGAVADSIPYAKMLEHGYDKVVVVLTKCEGYVKKPIPETMTKLWYKKKYPKFEEVLRNRHNMYNQQMEKLLELEKEGVAMVLRPSSLCDVSKTEKNPEKLEELYQLGVKEGLEFAKKLAQEL